MAINKVQYGNTVLLDLTDTTAEASDVLAGKYFYGKDGVKTLGTGTGGGHLTQDQDGFLVIPPNGSGGGGGSSDFSTANVTFICNGGEGYNFFIVSGYYIFNGEAIIPTSEVPIQVDYDVNVTVGIPLYKGESIRLPFLCFENTGENFPVCTGDIVLDTGGSFVISGDGTITIQGGELM